MTTREKELIGIKRLAANHFCDAPGCRRHATWQLTFQGKGFIGPLLLCAEHKQEVIQHYDNASV